MFNCESFRADIEIYTEKLHSWITSNSDTDIFSENYTAFVRKATLNTNPSVFLQIFCHNQFSSTLYPRDQSGHIIQK